MTKPKPPKPSAIACSFCGRPRNKARVLVAGPGVTICEVCVSLAAELVVDELRPGRDTVTDGAGI